MPGATACGAAAPRPGLLPARVACLSCPASGSWRTVRRSGLTARRTVPTRTPRLELVAAGKGSSGNSEGEPAAVKETSKGNEARTKELIKALEKQGMDLRGAKSVLKAWREAGIQTPEDLKQAMQERSRKVVIPAIVTQAVLDSSVAAVAFTISSLTSNSGSIFDVIYVVSTGIGLYYTFNAAFGVVTAVGLLGSKAASSSAESDAMMKAVRMLAGEESRIDLISKAQQAINMVKIVRSLNEVQSLLSQKVGDEQQLTSLESLAAYLTLANAEKDLGFDPAKYGLNEGEALKIAAKFARFDSNDDGTLELSEMEQLFRAVCDEKDECLIISFSPEELQAAMDVLDQNNNGAVEFDDFVGWYLAQLPEPPSSAEM